MMGWPEKVFLILRARRSKKCAETPDATAFRALRQSDFFLPGKVLGFILLQGSKGPMRHSF
jgi:hypothetical protein